MQALAALGVVAATPGLALASAPALPYNYGNPAPPYNLTDLNEQTLYPFLAVWLLLTTYPTFLPPIVYDPADPGIQSWAATVNLAPACVVNILNIIKDNGGLGNGDLTADPWKGIRTQYYQLVHKLALGTYSGSQCPKFATTFADISVLRPTLTMR